MKKLTINKMIAIIAVCGIGFISTSAISGPDESQRQMYKRSIEAKQRLQQAEAAKGVERQKKMSEHMQMMHDMMGDMQSMKPKAGMSMQEHEDWINEHQKLMDEMMVQMMQEHHMQMGMDCMSKGSGDMHKH